jgi:hypothetical protein
VFSQRRRETPTPEQAPTTPLGPLPGIGNQASLDALGLGPIQPEELEHAEQISSCLGELDLYSVQSFLQGLAW